MRGHNEPWARRAFWGVIVAAAVLLVAGAGPVPLLDPDESRFARTSVEMLRSGDLVVPHFEGRPRLVKPPLLHWIQAALFRWTGPAEWAARLPAAAATVGSLLLVAVVARRRFGEEAAAWAAAVLATMPLVFATGRIGTLDALLAVHVLAAVALDLVAPGEPRGQRALALGALLGLAFLVKGPVGLVLPLLVMLAGRTATGAEVLPSLGALLHGVAGWAVVVLPWGLAFVRRVGWHTSLDVLRGEAFERYFAGTTHVEPWWFYGGVLVVGLLPWIGPLLVALARLARLRRDPAARTATYAAAGLVAGIVFLSVGRSKLPNYLLPLAPLAALVVTWELGRELTAPRQRTAPAFLAVTLGLVALALGGVAAWRLEAELRVLGMAGAGMLAAGAAVAAWGVVRRRPRMVWGAAAASTTALLALAAIGVMPLLGQRRSSRGLVETLPALRQRPVATVDMQVPSLTFYLDRAPEVVDMSRLTGRIERGDDTLLVFDEDDLSATPPGALERLRELGRSGKYVVYEVARPRR